MFANVLDAPVAKLSMSNEVDVGENLIDALALFCQLNHLVVSYLIFFKTVLENILDYKTSSFS
jgi:hypothetical protein